MKLMDLYKRVNETAGVGVITLDSLETAIKNCLAEISAKGYKEFVELKLTEQELETTMKDQSMCIIKAPKNIKKILYCRLFFQYNGVVIAHRLSLADSRIQSYYDEGQFRTQVIPGAAIFYVKGEYLYIEYAKTMGDLLDIHLGYYSRLKAPVINFDESDTENLKNVNIEIKEEFEDALVFYSVYFYVSRFSKDIEKITMAQNQWKYFMEDISFQLSHEDEFNEDNAVVIVEE
jgi:hypothetical protein